MTHPHTFEHNGYKFFYTFEDEQSGRAVITAPSGHAMAILAAKNVDAVKAWMKQAKLTNELDNLISAFGFKGNAATTYPIK